MTVDNEPMTQEDIKDIEESQKDIENDDVLTTEEVKKELDLRKFSVQVSSEELAKLKSGELKNEDLVYSGGMTDAFVEECVAVMVKRAEAEANAQIDMTLHPEKNYLWPHEIFMVNSMKAGTIGEYTCSNVSVLVNLSVMEIMTNIDALKHTIIRNRNIFLNAKESGMEIASHDKRNLITSTSILESLYQQFLSLLEDAYVRVHGVGEASVENGRGEQTADEKLLDEILGEVADEVAAEVRGEE